MRAGTPSLARSTILNFLDTAINLASALVLSVVLARQLGPDRFGLYSLTMTVVTFTYIFVRLGINETVRRYVAELDASGRRPLVAIVAGRALALGLASATVTALLLAGAAGPLAAAFRHSSLRLYLTIGAITLFPTMAAGVFRNVLRGLQRYEYFVRLNLITSPLWLAACAVLVWRGAGIEALLLVGLAIELLNLAFLGWWTRREVGVRWRGTMPEDLRRRLLRYNTALALLILLEAVVWQRSELMFLAHFKPPSEVAYYALPFSLTERLGILVPGALLGVMLPGLTYAQSAADPAAFGLLLSSALKYLAMVTLPMCLFAVPIVPSVVEIVYGSDFRAAIPVLQILLLSTMFGVLGDAAAAALLGIERQSWLLATGVIAAFASLVLDLFLIPTWGAVGAAIANTVAQGVWAVASFAPLWPRISIESRRAIVRLGCLVLVLSGFVALIGVLRPALPALIASGVAATAVYVMALERLRLLPVRSLLLRLHPHQ